MFKRAMKWLGWREEQPLLKSDLDPLARGIAELAAAVESLRKTTQRISQQ
jgi:hypothetical protein